MFLKVHKPNNFELCKSLKVTLINIWGLPSNVVDLSLTQPFMSLIFWDIYGWLNWLKQFLCERLFLFDSKKFRCIHGLPGCLKKELSFARFLVSKFSDKNSEDSYVFHCFFFHSVSDAFFVYPTHCSLTVLFIVTSFHLT